MPNSNNILDKLIKRSLKTVEGKLEGRVSVHVDRKNANVQINVDGKPFMQLPPREAHKLAGALHGAAIAATCSRRETLVRNN